MVREISPEALRRACDPETLGFDSTVELKPTEGIVGQARALRALEFGLGISEHGFNICVVGHPGTGRTTAVTAFLQEEAQRKPVPPDWVYLNNFRDPYRPRALNLPSGKGKELATDLKRLAGEARQSIVKAFESEEYVARREEIVKTFTHEREEQFARLSEEAKQQGFLLQSHPAGLLLLPIKNGKPLGNKEFEALTPQVKKKLFKKKEELEANLTATMRALRSSERDVAERLKKLDREVALYSVGHLVGELREKYASLDKVLSYLQEVQDDILENLPQFRGEPEGQPQPPFPGLPTRDLLSRRYEVNVVVDNSVVTGAPVVMEQSATYPALVGKIERESQFGTLVTDYTMIRAGSLQRANGGYLVISLEEILKNPFSWDALKRAIQNREVRIEDLGERLGLYSARGMEPEPIPMEAKIVLIGTPYLYYLLHAYDQDFSELFKVKADFDTEMERDEENTSRYLRLICALCRKENLCHFDKSAAAKLVEYGSRLAENQEKLSTRFLEIADLMREANFLAQRENLQQVSVSQVMKAIENKAYRSGLIRDRILEMISRGLIMIDTKGAVVGQLNGLSVISLGDFVFGRPNRITVSVGLGRGGILDIEREAKLGGRIHSKGVLILSGYLLGKFARETPLALSARLVFEQSYEEVEGDSASSAELYCLLSSLSALPLRQSLAVTGSVNQKGQIQAIGGVNEKIEGFFALCQIRGLTGEEGVLIPEANLRNLMLKEEVVAAVQAGKFHIYPVAAIEEGIEILTGVPAGQRKEDGTFDEGTVFGRVDRRLQEMAQKLKGHEEERKKED